MNIFWLDEDVEGSARYHCDKHVSNMCIDYAQILSTAAHMEGFYDGTKMYEPVGDITPEVHEWAAESWSNYVRLLKLARHLGDEYEHRYGEEHLSIKQVVSKININEVDIDDKGFTDPPVTIPDEYKHDDGCVKSYRKYYIYGTGWKMSWFNRDTPEWYSGKEVEFVHE